MEFIKRIFSGNLSIRGKIFASISLLWMIFVGYLIPGLIASWMDRQGVWVTISTIIIISSVINLMLMVIGAYV